MANVIRPTDPDPTAATRLKPSLTDFLLARIAEDEAAGQAALGLRGSGTNWPLGHPLDPARVLAECEAKRRIVIRADYYSKGAKVNPNEWDFTLRDIATVYANHPDYREDWRP